MSYVIGTGFCESSRYDAVAFFSYWLTHIKAYTNPDHIFVLDQVDRTLAGVSVADTIVGYKRSKIHYGAMNMSIVPSGNLGHVHQLIKAEQPFKNHQLCGWSASVLALAMLAYNAERDFVYVEQDCLLVGRIVDAIIREADEKKKDMLFGSCKIMNAAQSLFFIRHKFIPRFVMEYLMGPADTDPHCRPEKKFCYLERSCAANVGRFSFGIDRDRPIPWGTELFYVQHLTTEELEQGIKNGTFFRAY